MNVTNTLSNISKAAAAAVLAGAAACLSVAAAGADPLPSYATGTTDETIHGTIASVDGQYRISVRDQRGFVDDVSLHQGTIINPTGLTLAPGQSVTILGHANGNVFAANEIDTPYHAVSYGYLGYPYAYPGYGYGYGFAPYPAYRVGFGFGRGVGFGFRGW